MSFENLFSIGAGFRIALGVIFALFLICFVAIIVEETFLGGRRRRKALKTARQRAVEQVVPDSSTADPAPQSSDTLRPPR